MPPECCAGDLEDCRLWGDALWACQPGAPDPGAGIWRRQHLQLSLQHHPGGRRLQLAPQSAAELALGGRHGKPSYHTWKIPEVCAVGAGRAASYLAYTICLGMRALLTVTHSLLTET